MVDMLTYHLQLRMKSKTEFPFLMYRLFAKIKYFPLVYRKPTFGEVYTHFDSFLPSTYRFGTVSTLDYRCFQTCLSWSKLCAELVFLKQIFLKKWLPWKYFKCFKKIMDNIRIVKEITLTVEKKPLYHPSLSIP